MSGSRRGLEDWSRTLAEALRVCRRRALGPTDWISKTGCSSEVCPKTGWLGVDDGQKDEVLTVKRKKEKKADAEVGHMKKGKHWERKEVREASPEEGTGALGVGFEEGDTGSCPGPRKVPSYSGLGAQHT